MLLFLLPYTHWLQRTSKISNLLPGYCLRLLGNYLDLVNYLDLWVWSSVVCMGSRAKATASPWSLGKLRSLCLISAQLSPAPVTSERGTCTSQQTALNPCSLPLQDGRLIFVFYNHKQKLRSWSPIFCSLFRVKWGDCVNFLWLENVTPRVSEQHLL